MDTDFYDEGIRERLILAGIHEIELHGAGNFSLRRVASACDVSCAAPYRHFKNRDELVLAIISYIHSRFSKMAEQIRVAYCSDTRRVLIETCIGLVRFFAANPNFLSVALPIGAGVTETERDARKEIESEIFELLSEYCVQNHVLEAEKKRLSFFIETLIYGTVILVDGQDAGKCDEAAELLRSELEKVLSLS